MTEAAHAHTPVMLGVSKTGLTRIRCSCGFVGSEAVVLHHIAVEYRRLVRYPKPLRLEAEFTEAELEAQTVDPRPGTGMRATAQDRDDTSIHDTASSMLATFRKLSQDETDVLIVTELHRVCGPDDAEQLVSLTSKTPMITHNGWTFAEQRGGIHSEPLVRVIAFRAWGARDLVWKPPIIDRSPPIQNIPARKLHGSRSDRARYLHGARCTDPNCDGQCVDR